MNIKSTIQAILLSMICTACASPKTEAVKAVPYPKKVCLVSSNALDSMGDTITEVYNGREVKFCCEPCVKKFHANPEKYLSRLH